MANLKYYNEATSEWETLVIGKQGPSGIANATAPVTYDGGTQTVGLTDSFIGQTVRSYANASTRATAIPSPTEGMYTHLEDSDRLDSYNGSAWVPATGATFIKSETFTSVPSISLNNIFSSLYRDYLIVFTGNSSAAGDIQLRLRAGSDATGNNYSTGRIYITESAGPSRASAVSANSTRVGEVQIYRTMFNLTISDPFIATTTSYTGQVASFGNNEYHGTISGVHSVSTSYDGITFFIAAGTITGTIKVYGYRS